MSNSEIMEEELSELQEHLARRKAQKAVEAEVARWKATEEAAKKLAKEEAAHEAAQKQVLRVSLTV